MRISDLSSDVCSSDLTVRIDRAQVADDMSFLLAACAADDTEKALRWLPGEGAALLADLGGIDEVWDDWLAAERARRHEGIRSEEHTSELQSLMRISYAVFCLKKKKKKKRTKTETTKDQMYHNNI